MIAPKLSIPLLRCRLISISYLVVDVLRPPFQSMVRNPISLILILAALLVAGCSVKSEERKIYNKEFNWTITIPAGFDSVKAEDWEKLQSKGTAAVEDTFGQEVVNQAKIIFVFKSGQ